MAGDIAGRAIGKVIWKSCPGSAIIGGKFERGRFRAAPIPLPRSEKPGRTGYSIDTPRFCCVAGYLNPGAATIARAITGVLLESRRDTMEIIHEVNTIGCVKTRAISETSIQ